MERQEAEEQPIYLDLADALELYAAIISVPSAQAVNQLRNRDGLESALARPQTYAQYQDADLELQAAVLAHGIAESQTFFDGNKRLALVAILTLLEINAQHVEASDPELAEWIISLSADATPTGLAELIRQRLRPR